MVHARIPDEWWRQSRRLSAVAKALFIDALTYTTGDLSDCTLDKSDLHRCTYLPEADVKAAMQELVAGGWWEDRGAAWWVGGNGMADHQYTRERVMAYRAKEREKKQKQRARASAGGGSASSTSPIQANPIQDTPQGTPHGSPPGDTRDDERDRTRDVTRDMSAPATGTSCCDAPVLVESPSGRECLTCGTAAA
jgi:hypothetical protein